MTVEELQQELPTLIGRILASVTQDYVLSDQDVEILQALRELCHELHPSLYVRLIVFMDQGKEPT